MKMLNISNERYVFIDTETGGTDPNKHSLLSVGVCVWDKNHGIIDQLELFIKHDNYIITKHAASINKFSKDSHEKVAVSPQKAIVCLIEFCRQYFPANYAIPLVGHNVQFDVNFLKNLFKCCGKSFNSFFLHRYIDTYSVYKTLVLADIIHENLNSSSDAFSYFNIKVKKRHSALSDCIATVELYEKMIALIKGEKE